MNIIQKPVPNFTKGRGDKRPEIIVIHLADGTKESVLQEFSNPVTQKSSHYLICKNREVWQFVRDFDNAYANGLKIRPTSKYVLERPSVNPNIYSLSIENEGTRGDIFSDSQYEDNALLVYELSEKWEIPLDRDHIIGHNEIRKDKVCPSPIDVNRVLKLAIEKKSQPIDNFKKIEELKIIQLSLLRKVLVALQAQLKKITG